MTDEIKRDAFGRELPPDTEIDEAEASEPLAPDNPGPKPSPDQAPLIPAETGGAAAEAPDAPAAPEVPSQLDPEPPIEDDASPTKLEFKALAARVDGLERENVDLTKRLSALEKETAPTTEESETPS